jgi:hypothetical protein
VGVSHWFVISIVRLIGNNINGFVPFLAVALQDGMMSGQGFMQRLRILAPLQRQATPPPQMQLVGSEDEEEELRDGRREEEGRYLDHEEQDEYEDIEHYNNGGYSSHPTSTSVVGQTGPRKYALYQEDDENDDEYDDQDTRWPVAESHPNGGNGASNPRGRQDPPHDGGYSHMQLDSSYDDGYRGQPHSPVTQGPAQKYTERTGMAQEVAVREASNSYGHVSDDDDEKGLEDLLSAHRAIPSTPTPPPPVMQTSSRSNSGIQRSKVDVELERATHSHQTRAVEVHAYLPEIAPERNTDSWKQGVDDMLKEGHLEYELDVEEEVVWEMGEESEADAHLDAYAEPDLQSDECSDEIRKTANRNDNGSIQEENTDIGRDPIVQQQQHQQHQQQEMDREMTKTLSQGLYESQRIEDLDVVGLSQWASPPQHLQSKESIADTSVVAAAVGVVAPVLDDGADASDATANMRLMATSSRLQREKHEKHKTAIVEESQGGIGGLMMEQEEDDISCLDVEGFDY